MIKNKEKRSVVHAKLKLQEKVVKRKKVKAREAADKIALELGEELPPKKTSRTIENTRELDETICKPDDDELFAGNDADEFDDILKQERIPKVLITTCRFNSTNHGNPTSHKPELVLTNFTTLLGHRVGRNVPSFHAETNQSSAKNL